MLMLPIHLIKIMGRERQKMSKVYERQCKLLPEVVRNAYAHVPYYRQLYQDLGESVIQSIRRPEDLVHLPIVTRSHLKEFPLQERMDERFREKDIKLSYTSGSSGIPLQICNSKRDLSYMRMVFINDLIQAGVRPWDRIVYLRVADLKIHFLTRFGIMPFYKIPTNQPIDWQVDRFLEYEPTFLTGFFNTSYLLVKALKERGIKYTKLKGLLLGGERVKESTKREIEDYFDAPVTEIYSTTDTFTVARECPRGNKHLHAGDLIVEVLKDDGTITYDDGEGEILVTRLVSEAMPLIRYELGDRVLIKPNDCPCGIYHTPILKEVYGRTNDFIVDEKGKIISSAILVCIADNFQEIKQIQFFQKSPKEVEILYVAEGEDIQELVYNKFSSELPQFNFQVRPVDSLVTLSNGKIKMVNSAMGIAP